MDLGDDPDGDIEGYDGGFTPAFKAYRIHEDPDQYQEAAGRTAIYQGHGTGSVEAIMYCTLGLNGEAGEVANQVKKIPRDDGGLLTPERRAKIIDELGDCLWYVAMAAKELGVHLSDLAAQNIGKLSDRAVRDAIHNHE